MNIAKPSSKIQRAGQSEPFRKLGPFDWFRQFRQSANPPALRPLLSLLVISLSIFGPPPESHAATINWTNTIGGNWSDAANWNPNQVPASSDTAAITAAGTYSVTNNGATVAGLSLGGASGPSGAQTLYVVGNALTLSGPGTVTANGTLDLAGGTLAGTGTLTVNGAFNWSSGTIAGTVSVNGTSSLSGPNTGTMTLSGVLANSGQLTWSGSGGNLYLGNGVLTNLSGGTINIAADVFAVYDGGNNVIGNAGLLQKTGGSNTTSLNALFVNSGDVQVQTGALNLPSGGSATGSFEVSSNATLEFSSSYTLNPSSSVTGLGEVNFNSGTINASGSYNVGGASLFTGATANFSGNYTISGQPVAISSGAVNFNAGGTVNLSALTMNGGTLGGSNGISVGGPFYWTNGTIADIGGVLLNGTSVLAGPGTGSMTLGGVLNNAGHLTWTGSGGNLYMANGLFTNLTGGTIDIAADVSAVYDGGNNVIDNAGLIQKTGGTNATSFNVDFLNSGDVQVQSGVLNLPGGGSATGSFEISTNATLIFDNTYTLNTGSSVTGSGTVAFDSGTINVTGNYNISGESQFNGANVNFSGNYTISGQPVSLSSGTVNFNAGGTVNLASLTMTGGTLGGTLMIAVSGPFNWTNGTIANSGGILLNGASTLAGPGTGSMTLSGVMENAGQLTWTGSGGNLYMANGLITNLASGTIIIAADISAVYDGGNNIFDNEGLLRKTGGANTTSLNLNFVNNGGVQVQSGVLNLPGGGAANGSFEVSTNAALVFNNDYALNAGSSTTGAGTVDFNSGSINAAGTYNVSGQSQFTGANVNFSGNYTVSGQPVTLSSGTVNFNAGGTVNLGGLTMTGGALGGTLPIAVSGPFNWTNGTIASSGGVLLNGTSLLAGPGTGAMTLSGVLNNAGQLTWVGSGGNLYMANGTISNLAAGTFSIAADVSPQYDGGNNTIVNAGVLRKTAGTGATSFSPAFFNSGDVQVQSGTLNLSGGASATGTFEVSTNATLQFSANYTLNPGSGISGLGTVNFSGGAINVSGNYGLSGLSDITGANVNFNAGGTLNISALTMTSGTLAGSAVVPVNGLFTWMGGTVATTNALLLNGPSSLAGPGTGSMTLNGILMNAGPLTWTGNGGNLYLASGTITNLASGTINIAADVSALYDGGNNVIGNAGIIRKTAGTNTTALNASLINNGDVQIQTGTLSLPSGGSASGTFEVSTNATLQFASSYTLNSGSGVAGLGTVNFNSGTINVSGNYGLAGLSDLTGAVLNFNSGGTFNIGPLTVASGTLSGSALIPINGLFTWTQGSVVATNGLLLNGPSVLNGPGTGAMSLTGILMNAGQLTWTGNGGNLYLASATVTNLTSGTITIAADVSAQYDGGNNFIGNAGVIRKTAGTGITSLNASVVNNGTIDAQKGALQFPGTLTLLPSSILNIGLNDGGGAAGTDFGVIDFTGNGSLTLNGTLSANLNSGFVPAVGSAFNVLDYPSSAGSFAATKLPPVAAWQTTVGATFATLTVLKFVPTLSWNSPAAIVYGTALGAAQLDATAASPTNLAGSLPGVFNYTPASGTILLSGSNQALSVAFTPSDSANYTNVSTNVAITVLKAPLTVTASNETKTYGQTKTFAGTEFRTSGPVNGDAVSSVTLASIGSAATAGLSGSPYAIVPSAAVGTRLTNYNITYQNGALAVGPAPLTVSASNASKIYGQTIVLSGGQFSATGLQNSETVGSVTLASLGVPTTAPAGSYPIIPSAATGGTFTPANYAIIYQNGSLMVSPAPLTITASNASKYFGQALVFSGKEFSSLGLQNSDTIASVTLASAGAPASASAGAYSIIPSAAAGGAFAAANYNIIYDNGTLTVNPLPTLDITPHGGVVVLSWPASAAGFVLQTSSGVSNSTAWTTAPELVTVIGNQNFVTNATLSPSAFYRLKF